jgi:hypothetical protein
MLNPSVTPGLRGLHAAIAEPGRLKLARRYAASIPAPVRVARSRVSGQLDPADRGVNRPVFGAAASP